MYFVNDPFVATTFGPLLQRLQDGSQQYFEAARITVEPLNYIRRPFSEVLRINVRDGERSRYAFVKIFKLPEDNNDHLAIMQRRVARDFETTKRVYQIFRSHPGLASVKPIACFPEQLALVTEQVTGETLSELIQRQAVWRPQEKSIAKLSHIFAQVGTWLRTFQEAEPSGKQFSLERLRTYIDERLTKLVDSDRAGFSAADRAGVLRYLDARGADVPEQDLREVSIHADLCPENVMVNGSEVILLDFTMAKTGATYHDVTHMFMYLELLKRKPFYQTRVGSRLQEALLSGYEPGLRPDRALFELLLLQHIITHLASMTNAKLSPFARLYHWHLWRPYQIWVRKLCRYEP